MSFRISHIVLALSFVAATPAVLLAGEDARPKNIIVMLADGAGYNTLDATRFWLGRNLVADDAEFQPTSVATYSLRRSRKARDMQGDDIDPLAQDPGTVYDPEKAWDTTPITGPSAVNDHFAAGFAGYEWHRSTYPDSANTMSQLMTGVRSYNGAINVDGNGDPVKSIAEAMHEAGGRTGIVTSVMLCDATPAAGGGAHNVSRGNFHAITRELFGSGTLDLIAGGGNPEFDSNGIAAGEPGYDGPSDPYRVFPPEVWADLKNGTNTSGVNADDWTLVSEKEDIEALAVDGASIPPRLAIVPQTADYFQQHRDYPPGSTRETYAPGDAPFIENVPSLATVSNVALRALDGEKGFFLMIEGGAVDKAMHGMEFGRMIEEYADFDEAVQAVVEYLESGEHAATFENTLLVITADHDHLLFGPDSDTVPFQPIEDRGAGVVPGYKWQFNSHSNRLVPLFARGAGADGLIALADEVDYHQDAQGREFGFGHYTTQPEVGAYLLSFVDEADGD